jgi:hypothetical protein
MVSWAYLDQHSRIGIHYVLRVNILCPSLISTSMASRVWHIWKGKDKVVEINNYTINITASPALRDGTLQTELAVYVEGGKGWEIESELEKLEQRMDGSGNGPKLRSPSRVRSWCWVDD